ncbi:MAG: TonB-dependent receptor plug domain-containing protein [Kiritimatiellae bacterium]|nr:TonB-dependent receptor plug domain-containing protein [Kiritimatiellia bacterium]
MNILKILVAGSLISIVNLFAQEAPVKLQELTIYAPIESPVINKSGELVSTVSEQQIKDLNAFDLQSALKNVPGVTISKYNVVGNFGGAEGGGIFIRGMGTSRPGGEVLTLVDDIPKMVAVWSHPMMDFLNINVVERIDVYKGAQPVKFGNKAFAAVNMITKRPLEEGYNGNLSLQYGSFNTFKESFMFSGKSGDFDYIFANTYATSDGHRKDADGYIFNATTKFGYELDDNWDATLFVNVSDNYANDPGSSDLEVLSKGKYYTDDFMVVASLENSYDEYNGYIKAYYQYGKLDWQDQDETPGLDTITKYSQYGTHLKENISLSNWLDLMTGFDCDVSTGNVNAKVPAKPNNKSDYSTFIVSSPYAAASTTFEGIVDSVFTFGARHFLHSEFDSEFAPEVGAVFSYNQTKLALNYAKGVNYPGLFVKINSEIFMPGDNRWEDLKAETVDHYEASLQQTLFDSFTVTFSSFFDYGNDRIIVVVPPFPPSWQNVDDFSTKGFELSASWNFLDDASLFAGATWMYDVDPVDLPYIPELSINFGISWEFMDDWKIVVDGTYMDSYYALIRKRNEPSAVAEKVDSFFVNNCKLYYTLSSENRKPILFSLSVDNIFNVDYEYYPGYQMPGTSVMFGIELEI